MHPKELKIDDFTYDLPNDKIAYSPANPRDSSKLLLYKNGEISQDIYQNISNHLSEDHLLVFNNTKVIKSRIFFTKDTGAVIEIFCLEPHEDTVNYEDHFQQTKGVLWKCLIGKAGKWKEKQLIKSFEIDGQEVSLCAEIVEKLADCFIVQLSWAPENFTFGEIIDVAGVTPLPPYIKRKATHDDENRYQTVYSEHDGSVAAPTAGLHFTKRILDALKEKKVETLFTTLHVGAGTFKPVSSATMEDHQMHNEWMNITSEFLFNLLQNLNKTIISVGTTSMRTLESIYWMGNKIILNPNIREEDLRITQWEPYENIETHSAKKSLQALLSWMDQRGLNHLLIETGIIIAPSYTFKIVKGLVTNFHQPKSTLLLLVAALVGEEWKEIYDYALAHDFRFLSYGDGGLLLPENK